MRTKLLLAGLAAVTAAFIPTAFGSAGSLQAVDCPAGVPGDVCGAVNLVVGTACGGSPLPVSVPTVGPVTINIDEGGSLIACPI